MHWILLSGLGTAALLLTEFRDFIRDRWPRRPTHAMPIAHAVPMAQAAPTGAAWQHGDRFATQGPRVTCRCLALEERGWQSAARRLAGQWTVLDDVSSHPDAGRRADAGRRGAASRGDVAIRRTLSSDQILSARISAAYAVWAAARSTN